mgnify:CR=1 FL=1
MLGGVMEEKELKTTGWETIRSRELSEKELAGIRDSLRGLRFGMVQIVVQDGAIVQIDRTDKRRLR